MNSFVWQNSGVEWTPGDVVRKLREAQKVGALEFAKRAGVSNDTLRGVEDWTGNPSSTTMEKIAIALGVKVADLYALVPEQRRPSEPDPLAPLCEAVRHAYTSDPTARLVLDAIKARYQAAARAESAAGTSPAPTPPAGPPDSAHDTPAPGRTGMPRLREVRKIAK